jgi:hypothetical protein
MPWDPPIPGRALCRSLPLSSCRSLLAPFLPRRLFKVGEFSRPQPLPTRSASGRFWRSTTRLGRRGLGACRARAVREQGESTWAGASRACASRLEQGARGGASGGKSTRAGCASRREPGESTRAGYCASRENLRGQGAGGGASRVREQAECTRAECASRIWREQGKSTRAGASRETFLLNVLSGY